LNRHQHLPRLAKAYHWTGDERYAAEAVAQLRSWIEQNPPGFGINWQSSLEIGIRAVSWLWTMFLLLPSRHFDDAAAQRIGDSLFAQLEHVHRYTSEFSSPNTHLIGEAAALFIGGTVFRDRKRSAAWMRHGAALLVREADRQILDDGVHGDLAACYHCYALDFYLQALVLADPNHFRFPESMRARSKACCISSCISPRPWEPFLCSAMTTAAALSRCSKPITVLSTMRSAWARCCSSGPISNIGRAIFRKRHSGSWVRRRGNLSACSRVRRRRRSGGLCERRLRDSAFRVGPLASQLVFDIGGLGLLTGGHSHADALSLVLSSQGRELLVDPGTYVYNCAPEWRSWFRSTRAHNTVEIDGCDQAETGGTFRWKTRMSTRMLRDPSFPPEYLEAEHDGYERLPHGVTHRRRLLHIPGRILDRRRRFPRVAELRGTHFDFHYHFGAGVDPVLVRPRETDAAVRAEQAGLFLGIYAPRRSHPNSTPNGSRKGMETGGRPVPCAPR
jgi:hypothetical protein